MDRYRERRSPERERSRYPQPTDSYIPPTSSRAPRPRSRSPNRYRPRSRTPPRVQADTWRSHPRSRSPPRRYDGRNDNYPARDLRARREYSTDRHVEEGHHPRARSPTNAAKRPRELSPAHHRTSPAVKRDRVDSPSREYERPRSPPSRHDKPLPVVPRNEYRPRSRTPPRRDARDEQYTSQPYRRRSPSPRIIRPEPRSAAGSRRNSVASSRRSSPRPPQRPMSEYDSVYRDPLSLRQAPSQSDSRSQGVPSHDYSQNGGYPAVVERRVPPTGPSSSEGRPPPTGPSSASRQGAQSMTGPPSGPSAFAAAPLSMSAHTRSSTSTAPPTYPRGGGFRGRGGPSYFRDYPPRGGRGGWEGGSSHGRGAPSQETFPPREGYSSDARSGGAGRGFAAPPANFRGSANSTSTTYPRTQRFNVPATSVHLADLPSIKDGGERMSPVHDMSKADKLEEEAARLRKMIDDKQEAKRLTLREWENLERQSKSAAMRTEMAEESLRGLSDEGGGVGGVAAF